MDVEIAHDQVNFAGKGISLSQIADDPAKLRRRSTGRSTTEIPTRFGFDHGKDIGRSATPVFVVALGNVAWP
jgi:hypothetical protein